MMFCKMAVSRTFVFFVLYFGFLLIFTGALPARRTRLKRELDDDDIVLGLKLYEAKMTGMQRKIARQLAIMKKQKSRIDDIKYYLRRKGDDYEKDDLEAKIIADTEKAKQNLQLISLDNLVREVDHQWTRQRELLEALEKENNVMDDIHERVLENRAVCRDAHTDWKDQASGTIKELSRHYVNCNDNELVMGFYLQKKSATENQVRYNYRCCLLSVKDNWQKPDDM